MITLCTMMGFAVINTDIPVLKQNNAILAFSKEDSLKKGFREKQEDGGDSRNGENRAEQGSPQLFHMVPEGHFCVLPCHFTVSRRYRCPSAP